MTERLSLREHAQVVSAPRRSEPSVWRTLAVRPGARQPEPTSIKVIARSEDGARAYVVTRFAKDGGIQSQGWRATGLAKDAPSPADFIGVGGFARLGPQAVGRTFWSGSDEAMMAAAEFARRTGGVTLDQTLAGVILGAIAGGAKRVVGPRAANLITDPLWSGASRSFARGAEGEVNASLAPVLRPKSRWVRDEEPILKLKNKIIVHEP